MADKQPEALLLAEIVATLYVPHTGQVAKAGEMAAAELRRQHALIAELVGALEGLDEAFCHAESPLSRDERHKDRQRLIAARAALAKAKEAA
jgi:hypothetical protein